MTELENIIDIAKKNGMNVELTKPGFGGVVIKSEECLNTDRDTETLLPIPTLRSR